VDDDLPVWRLGHRSGPLEPVPWALCGWQHRWDDPQREYRTLYAAREPETCLREVLADLRPSTKVLAELEELFGPDAAAGRDAGVVSREWRDAHRLCPAWVVGDGPLADVDGDLALRRDLERRHARMLADRGMDHLDIAEVRRRDRILTQTLGRDLHGRGFCGVVFGSHLDDQPCLALFEGRAALRSRGTPRALEVALEPLVAVCDELGLRVER
jgi:hypothetical protein